MTYWRVSPSVSRAATPAIWDNVGDNNADSSIDIIDKRRSLAWINNSISPQNLLEEFIEQDFIKDRLKARQRQRLSAGFPVLSLNRHDFDHLAKAFAAAYPSEYIKEVDAMRRGLENYIVEVSKYHQNRQVDKKSGRHHSST